MAVLPSVREIHIEQEFIEPRAALYYWGACLVERNVSPMETSRQKKIEAILYGVPRASQQAVVEAYLASHREGLQAAVVASGPSLYQPYTNAVHRLVDDPHQGAFVFIGVEVVLLSMVPEYQALAAWHYIRGHDVSSFPSKQSANAKWQMHYRLVSRVNGRLNKPIAY